MNKASNYNIKLVNRRHLEKDYYSFDFTKPEGFIFTEGQFGVFCHIGKEVEGRKLRAFSFASVNEEPFIRIATKIIETPSDFKQKLLDMPLGDEISLDAPLGEFVLNEGFDAIFIAGGIGTTPIRSMLFSKKRLQSKQNSTLIYSELDGNYPFKTEMDNLPGLELLYAADILPTQKAIIQTASKHHNEAYYYLSGSPGFCKGITALLQEHGISKERIKYDVFIGY